MSLAQHLDQQRNHLEAFIALLEAERETLATGQADGALLASQAEQKQTHITQLEALENQRLLAQRKLGYGEGRRGAETAARDAGCLDSWREFLERTLHAKQLNQLNGALVGSRLTQNQRILDFLNEAVGKTLYGPDGQSRRRGFGGGVASRA